MGTVDGHPLCERAVPVRLGTPLAALDPFGEDDRIDQALWSDVGERGDDGVVFTSAV